MSRFAIPTPFPAYKLVECIDWSEEGDYWSLDDKEQHLVDLIITSGWVDMYIDIGDQPSWTITKLRSLFSEGTITRTNIENLLTPIPEE